jgi:hypothetical protein
LRYLRPIERASLSEGLRLGGLWLAINILIDAPLMLLGGPMKMSLGAYLADIGVTYLILPLVTTGLVAARRSPAGG